MTKSLDRLMQQEMTRKEFIATLGLGVISILGFGRIVELLTGRSVHKNIASHSLGYDEGVYGGKNKTLPKTTAVI